MKKALQINGKDNVATATNNIEEEEKVQVLSPEGEVVLVNEKFGIRLTNIASPGDRVKSLS